MIRIFEPIDLKHLAGLYSADLADLEEYNDGPGLHELLIRETDLLLEELGYRNVVIDAIKPHKIGINERGYLEAAFREDYYASMSNMTTDVVEAYREELARQGYASYSSIFEAEADRKSVV